MGDPIFQAEVLGFLRLLGVDPSTARTVTVQVTPVEVMVEVQDVRSLFVDAKGVPVTLDCEPSGVALPAPGESWSCPIIKES